MSLKVLILFFSAWNLQAASKDLERFCQGKLAAANFKKQAITDCKLAGGLAASEDVQSYAKEMVAKVLIEKTASQIQQHLQNLALNDQFFNSIEMQLLRPQDTKLKNSCRLDNFNQLDRLCGKDQKANPDRIKQIQTALGFASGTLKQNLSQMFIGNLGQGLESNSCPVSGSGQGFLMSGQLDDEFQKIFDTIKNSSSENIDKMFDLYPQLKLLSQSNQKDAFVQFVKTQTSSLSDRNLVTQFYKTHPQLDFRSPIVEQCNDLVYNLRDVVCDKIPNPVSLDPIVSAELYKYDTSTPSMDDQFENGEETYLGFALNCQNTSRCHSEESCIKLCKEDNNCIVKCKKESGCQRLVKSSVKNVKDAQAVTGSALDEKFKSIDSSLRKTSSASYDLIAQNFCSYYSCTSDEVKGTASCQNGGPLSLNDFKVTFDCPKGTKCNDDKKLMYTYLKNYEIERLRVAEFKKNNANIMSADAPSLYSGFVENFLGVEQTLIAEGKEVTTEAVKAREQSFQARGLATGEPPAPSAERPRREMASVTPSPTSTPAAAVPTTPTTAKSDTTTTDDSWAPPVSSGYAASSGSSIAKKPLKKLEDEDDTTKDLRSQIDQMIKDMKATPAQQLSTVADNNSNFFGSPFGNIPKNQGLDNSDQQRLKDLQSQLSQLKNQPQPLVQAPTNQAYEEQSRLASAALAARPQEDNYGYDPKQVAAAAAAAKEKESAVLRKGALAGSVGVLGKTVRSEDLIDLKLSDLKEFGISENSDTFVIKVVFNNQIIEVPVKRFVVKNGKIIFAPIFNANNKMVSELILDSPIFDDYREYQLTRAKDRRASGLNSALNSPL